MLSTISSFRLISENLDRTLETTAETPLVARETSYYLSRIGDIKTIDDFIADDRIFSYAMTAHGLEDMTYAKAFMRKVLTEGIDSDTSFANTLSDTRYRQFAETYNFERYADATTAFDRTQQGAVDKYLRQTLEVNAGAENQGVRLALYFERKASEITSPFGILADPALLTVMQTALGLSPATSAVDIDRQAELITERFNIEDLQDPEKLDELLQRFAVLWEVSNPQSAAAVPNILIGQSRTFGFGSDLLAAIQNFRIGGR
ncbi:MAG: DUF1217 domain-containing protein [Hyphomicrobiaceae bacterium]